MFCIETQTPRGAGWQHPCGQTGETRRGTHGAQVGGATDVTQPARRPVYASFAVDLVRANRMGWRIMPVGGDVDIFAEESWIRSLGQRVPGGSECEIESGHARKIRPPASLLPSGEKVARSAG